MRLGGEVDAVSRWRRQQRKRARRAREWADIDAEFSKGFDSVCEAIEEGLAQIRELSIRYEVRAFEARLRAQRTG